MSLETSIQTLNTTIERLIAALEKNASPAVASAPQAGEAPDGSTPSPIERLIAAREKNASPAVASAPAAAPQVTTYSEPVPALVPVSPAIVSAATDAPFADHNGLVQYLMGAYRAMGAERGAMIQTVLTSLGCANITDVKPEHYARVVQGVESLKKMAA